MSSAHTVQRTAGPRRRTAVALTGLALATVTLTGACALPGSAPAADGAQPDPGGDPGVSPTAELPDDAGVHSKDPGERAVAGGTSDVAESERPTPSPSPSRTKKGTPGGGGFPAAYAGTWSSQWFRLELEKGGRSAVLHPASGVCTWSLSLTGGSGSARSATVDGSGACGKHDRADLALDGSDALTVTLKGGTGDDAVKEIPLTRG
ncbi:hypothetical protein CLV63_11160 [Murinocardiopsis flavida]|uniref:Uncharacterized protein n=1 Tax=Murinocardiopsis flavida TaxID=645275 RepID=A0A2P8DGX4_9ACTN|nr:hypothetical protein [Murinocardiopsis flavida]PSK96465.1 hypothetical protein CLV63_11160 [Murinocardiopsis flavida]